MKPSQSLSQVTCRYVLHKQEQRTPLHAEVSKQLYSKLPVNHEKEVISHHSLPCLPRGCAKMCHILGFPFHLSVSASVLVKKTASEAEHSPVIICTV